MASVTHTGSTFELVSKQAFHTVILPLKHKLYRFAYSFLRNEEDAKDVVQDVMIKSWEQMEAERTLLNAEAWCMTLVKNRSLDRIKRKNRNHLQVVDRHDLYTDTADPLEQTSANDIDRQMRELIELLPEKQRMVIDLRDVEGYSYQEISEILDISIDNVKVLLHRARKQIRTAMKHILNHGV